MLAAFTDGLYWLDWKKGHRELIQAYQPEQPTTRMNDGVLDRQGRFVVGGMDEDGMAATTAVWSVTTMGVQELFAGVGCSNSTAFSPDGGTMYFADSARHEIVAFDYDIEKGKPSNKQHFAEMDRAFGKPDGSCVDAEGGLWNARFGGSCVQRFRPDGTPDIRVSVAVPNVTSCCFGGAGLNRLFITTAAMGMSEEESAAAPTAGGIFAIDLPIRGLEHGTFNEESKGR
jgi:L-arabinonolactonase